MGGSKATTCVSVKEFIEPEILGPIWIEVEFVIAVVTGAPTFVITGKDVLEAVLEFFGYMAEVNEFT